MIIKAKIIDVNFYIQEYGYYPESIVTLVVHDSQPFWSNGHSWLGLSALTVEILADEEEKQVIFMLYPELKKRPYENIS